MPRTWCSHVCTTHPMLLLGRMGEVERNEFSLQTGCLKLVVVKVEFDNLLLRKPISEA